MAWLTCSDCNGPLQPDYTCHRCREADGEPMGGED